MSRLEKPRPTTTVRIETEAHEKLRSLAERRGEPMTETLSFAIDRLMREQYFRDLDTYYAELRQDPEAWQHQLDERAAWAASEQWDDE